MLMPPPPDLFLPAKIDCAEAEERTKKKKTEMKASFMVPNFTEAYEKAKHKGSAAAKEEWE